VPFDVNNPKLLVGSDWVGANESYDVIDPYTGNVVARVPQGDAGLLDRAIAVAHDTFAKTRTQPPFERAKILHTAAAMMEKRKQQLTDTIVAEAGKPVTLAEAEVARAIMTITASAEAARQPNGQVLDLDAFSSGAGHFGVVRRFPVGVVYCVTPFNFPLNLVAHKLGPVIATGNTAVLKPAPRTPLSALLLVGILLEAGMTPGQVNVVTCPNELAGKPVTDDRVAMVSFTGSAKVGWGIHQGAGSKKVVLELGGNAPAIVELDADLPSAIALLASGGFGYAGQSCIHTQRVYVHDEIYTLFRDAYVRQVKEKIKAGDPRDRATVVGPMIDRGNIERVTAWVNEAAIAGAKLLIGGRSNGPVYEPTVLENVPQTAKVVCEEIFGPVVVLHPYKTFDDAIALANATRYGIHAGVFTRDIAKAMRAYERLDFGGVLINQAPTFRVETLPYGGVKDSGVGREGVRYAMDDMTELKAMVMKI
jgi:acyl-CoA reductase-like NAD-dependent aldehyde dehydrogenase